MNTSTAAVRLDGTIPSSAIERPTDIAVHCIKDGKVGRGTVRTPLPDFARGRTWFGSGPLRHHSSAALQDCAEIVARCAPWITAFCGPILWHRIPEDRDPSEYRFVREMSDGGVAATLAGQAWNGQAAVFIGLSIGSHTSIRSTVHHELWHALEYHLPAKAFEAVDKMAAGGCAMSSAYYESQSERRARLYENMAGAWDEGATPPADARDLGIAVLWYVYSGLLAQAVEAKRYEVPRYTATDVARVTTKGAWHLIKAAVAWIADAWKPDPVPTA